MLTVPQVTFRDVHEWQTWSVAAYTRGENVFLFSVSLHPILATQLLIGRYFGCCQHSTLANSAAVRQ